MFQLFLGRYQALINSCKGLKNTWFNEVAFRMQVLCLLIIIPLSFYLGKNAIEYVLLLGSAFLVLIVEQLNTAIEVTVDRISLEFHELSGLAKDCASAAVFLTMINMLITWIIIIFL